MLAAVYCHHSGDLRTVRDQKPIRFVLFIVSLRVQIHYLSSRAFAAPSKHLTMTSTNETVVPRSRVKDACLRDQSHQVIAEDVIDPQTHGSRRHHVGSGTEYVGTQLFRLDGCAEDGWLH